MAPKITPPKMYEGNFTAFRGIFCLLIVLFHYSDAPTISEYPILNPLKFLHQWKPIGNGYLWLYYFYFLSGFILTKKYFFQATPLKLYFKKRILRIFPLHLFLLLAYVIRNLLTLDYQTWRLKWETLAPNIFLIQNWIPDLGNTWNYPAWTLSSEWFLYIVFGGLLLLQNKFKLGGKGNLILGGFLMLLTFVGHDFIRGIGMNLDMVVRDGRFFILGMILGLISDIYVTKLRLFIWPLQIFSLISLIWISTDTALLPHLFWAFTLLIVSFSGSSTIISRTISNPVSLWLGERSFTLYLCHIPVLELISFKFSFLHPIIGVLVSFILLIGFTMLLHAIFEKKILQQKGI